MLTWSLGRKDCLREFLLLNVSLHKMIAHPSTLLPLPDREKSTFHWLLLRAKQEALLSLAGKFTSVQSLLLCLVRWQLPLLFWSTFTIFQSMCTLPIGQKLLSLLRKANLYCKPSYTQVKMPYTHSIREIQPADGQWCFNIKIPSLCLY